MKGITLPRMSSEATPGISRAADGLHGDRHDGFEAEFLMKRRQCQDETDR